MKIDLTGKTVLVTASSKGIGFGIAKCMLQAGAKVAICARGQDALSKASEQLARIDSERKFSLAGDIGDLEFLGKLVAQTQEHFGATIDILVNNNGGPPATEALGTSEEQWTGALNRNLMSVVRLSNLVVPGMREKKWGRIINIASTTAKEPDPGMTLSNVTRAGVAAYSKTLAREVGPWGITVNTILTGGCLTERLYQLLQNDIEGTNTTLDEAVERAAATFPVRFIPTPEEFAQTILFLASEESAFITGTAIPIDGGLSKSIF